MSDSSHQYPVHVETGLVARSTDARRKLDPTQVPEQLVEETVLVLRTGGVIIAPTETSYMLAGAADQPAVVQRIYAIKRRPLTKPLPVIVGDLTIPHHRLEWSPRAQRLAEKFWPGPLTVVVPRKPDFLPDYPGEEKTLALRVSGFPFAREVARRLGAPLISTSANLSGDAACYSVTDMPPELLKRADLVIDAGQLAETPSSTIVALSGQDVRVLRPGPISWEAIAHALCLE